MEGQKPNWLGRTVVAAPVVAVVFFLGSIALVAVLDLCRAEGACSVVLTAALWGAGGFLALMFVARIVGVVIGMVWMLRAGRRSGSCGTG